MPPPDEQTMSYADRLATFEDYWEGAEATARQLAILGHVSDRPPLEALEEGSRCISCGAFAKKEESIAVLQGPFFRARRYGDFRFHHARCYHIQVKSPLDIFNTYSSSGLTGGKTQFESLRRRFDTNLSRDPASQAVKIRREQTSSLFSLPTELRLAVYAQIMPKLERTTTVLPLNKHSDRVITEAGFFRKGPRDDTKINLLSTCRAVHAEALDILFSAVTYKFESAKLLYSFLRHIGADGRQLLKSVDVMCGSREDGIAFALLGSCEKLRNITIRLPRPMLLFPRAPLWCVEGMASLLQLSGLERVYFGECQAVNGNFLSEAKHDAQVLRAQLLRPKGDPSSVRWVNGTLDI